MQEAVFLFIFAFCVEKCLILWYNYIRVYSAEKTLGFWKGIAVTVCPYCGQGRVLKAELKTDISKYSGSQIIRYCDECDTVWKEDEPVSENTGSSFSLIAEMLSIPEKLLWEGMKIL